MPEISAKLRIKKAINRLEEDAANKYKDLRNLNLERFLNF